MIVKEITLGIKMSVEKGMMCMDPNKMAKYILLALGVDENKGEKRERIWIH
jgi:hypothetical protein